MEVSQPLNNLNASQIILGASSHRELYLCLPLGGQNTHEQYEHSNKEFRVRQTGTVANLMNIVIMWSVLKYYFMAEI